MYPIDNRTASAIRPPSPKPGTKGWFTHGDPEKGEAPTVVDADWMNRVQAELMNVVTSAGIPLKKNDSHQLLGAIRRLVRESPYVPGQIIALAAPSPPPGTLQCDGTLVSRKQYKALFDVIGERYGEGDGSTTFRVPTVLAGHTLVQALDTRGGQVTTPGAVMKHSHPVTVKGTADHNHEITVDADGFHGHGATATDVGDHIHSAWTDVQGHHAHSGSTSVAGWHSHVYEGETDINSDGAGKGASRNHGRRESEGSGNHAHDVGTHGAGSHGHGIGVGGAGTHSHAVSVAGGGNHAHQARSSAAGSHSHEAEAAEVGGSSNFAAGLRVFYFIAY
jgi:microcystin-dependent protein